MTRYVLIGDVHSQGTILSKALKLAKEQELTPVFLGDLFDSRGIISETTYVYNQVRLAQRELGAIVLNSNHQDRLLHVLDGHIKYSRFYYETWRSMEELIADGVNLPEIKQWLKGLPFGFVFRDLSGVEHCCSHAQFPSHLRDPSRKTPYFITDVDEKTKDEMIWGTMGADGHRLHWWNAQPKNQDWVRCAGHYHTVDITKTSVVLDANCGFDGGSLPIYIVDDRKTVYFR